MNDQTVKQCKSILTKNHLHPIRKIGKGAFAIVFLVQKIQLYKNQNELYSVKCINKKQVIKRPSLNKYIKQEIQILRNLQHQNVVRSFRTFQDQGWIFMVMEYCNKGNLFTKVTENNKNILSVDQTFYITYDIVKGLDYIHKKNLIHRDIKAQNILLTAFNTNKNTLKNQKSQKNILSIINNQYSKLNQYDYVTKICDFGFAREQDESVNTFCGTTYYMAPQIFSKSNYDYKVDIWSLGVLIFYMLFGEFPFKGMNIQYEIQKKCHNGFSISKVKDLKQNDSISKQDYIFLDDLFRKIFVLNPAQRINLEDINEFPWFKKYQMPILTYQNYNHQIIPKTHPMISITASRSKTMKKKQPQTKTKPQLYYQNTNTNSDKNLLKIQSAAKRTSQKTTIQSDSSEDLNLNKNHNKYVNQQNEKLRNFQLEKYQFIRDIIDEVQKYKFLKPSEEIPFKYYMFKMLFAEFQKVLSHFKSQKNLLENLIKNLEKYTKLMDLNIKKIQIGKFQPQLYQPKAKEFIEFKQPYRLVIGHVFSKAHKSITQGIQVRSQLKLKLFICHVINRVFNPQTSEGVFVHYENYLSRNLKINHTQGMDFKLFRKWIETQTADKLVDTVELMNARFYKGK